MLEFALVMLLHALGHADDLGAALDLVEELLAGVRAELDVLARAGGHQKHLVCKRGLERRAGNGFQFGQQNRLRSKPPSVGQYANDAVGD